MSGWTHGKAIVNGEVQYLSVSALQLADGSTGQGCLRRYWYAYLMGLKEPPNDSLREGIAGHERLEHFLKTGERHHLTSRELANMSIVPEPGPDLEVEKSLVPLGPDGKEDLRLAPLRVSGIPMVGKIDCRNPRSSNDPPGTVELLDWKFVGKMTSAKNPNELPETIQMAGYAEHEFITNPRAEFVRLSHGYFPKRGQPEKRSIRVAREAIRGTWEHANHLAGSIRDAAREKNPDLVDANTRACRAYGRDCPALSVCKAGQHDSLSSIIGVTAAAGLLAGPPPSPIVTLGARTDMSTTAPTSIAARIAAARAGGGTPAPASASNTTTPNTTTPDAAAVAAELTRLAMQETRSKHPLVDGHVNDIRSFGVGFPTLSGPAADIVGRLAGIKPVERDNDHFIDGEGALAQFVLPDVELLPKVIEDLIAAVARGEITMPGESPAASSPKLDDAPASDPALATSGPSPDAAPAADAIATLASDAPTKGKRGSKKKAETESAASLVTASPVAEMVAPSGMTMVVNGETQQEARVHAEATASITLFVDCCVESTSTVLANLWDVVDGLRDDLARRAGLKDIRLAGPESPLGFGKWKGALAAFIRETKIPPGYYYLPGGDIEVRGVVVDAMRDVVRRSGGVLVTGVR